MAEMTMGQRIALLRKRKGLTQDKLAELVGVTPQAVSKWENDSSCPDINIIPRLAEIFGVSTDVLLGTAEMPDEAEVVEGEVIGSETNKKVNTERHIHVSLAGLAFPIFIVLLGASLIYRELAHIDVGFFKILLADVVLGFGIGFLLEKVSAFSIGLTGVGVYMALTCLDIIPKLTIHWSILLALLLVLWGISMIIERFRPRKHKHAKYASVKVSDNGKAAFNCEDGYLESDVSFSEETQNVDCDLFKGGDIDVKFGEVNVYLTDCTRIAEGAVLNANAAFGSCRIFVSKHVRVEDKHSCAFGDVSVKGAPNADAGEVLMINAKANFGSIEIIYV